MANGNIDNLIPFADRPEEEQREIRIKGGIASGKARREKADLRKMMQAALDVEIKGGLTHAQRLTQSILNVAENPKNGAAAVRAYETILHIIGQDEPEPRADALDLLRQILEANKENARVQAKQETE